MANLNDYKIIGKKGKKYFELLQSIYGNLDNIKEEKEKERMGFYLFTLEYLTGVRDLSSIVDLVTDTDFNIKVFKNNFDDLGVDAVNINDDENIIQLFSFKYREKFTEKTSKINEVILSTKLINAIYTKIVGDLSGKIREKVDLIIDKLDSSDEWKLQLFIVSNENFEVGEHPDLDRLKELYGLEVINIGLNEISQFIALVPDPIDAELVLDVDAVMSFSEDSISSAKSYIIRLPLSEVVRITSDNKELRNEYNIEDVSKLSLVKLDFSILFDNVRGFIVKSRFNSNILNTLKNEPTRFFIYNNGLTLTAKDIEVRSINANKKFKIKLKSIQVLNGGQTLRTIHSFNQENVKNIENILSVAQISLRIFKISSDLNLNNNIAEFTNSQNAISNIDLKSLRMEQLQLEQYLSDHEIVYVRKSGDTGLKEDVNYKYRISMEKFGQILFSLRGHPEKATNQKKNIFDKYYNDIFGEGGLKIVESPKQIEMYFIVKGEYEGLYSTNDQKIFYIIYIYQNLPTRKLSDLINEFEKVIKEYIPPKDDTSDARKLIQKSFKDFVDKKFNITNK